MGGQRQLLRPDQLAAEKSEEECSLLSPYPDLRAMTRSHLPRQWRPDEYKIIMLNRRYLSFRVIKVRFGGTCLPLKTVKLREPYPDLKSHEILSQKTETYNRTTLSLLLMST